MTSIVQEVETGSESDDVFQSPEKHSKSFGSDGDAAQDASDSAHVPPVVKEVAADSSSTNQADPDDDAQREQLINEIIGLQQTLRDLSQRVQTVRDDHEKMADENGLLIQYIDNLMQQSVGAGSAPISVVSSLNSSSNNANNNSGTSGFKSLFTASRPASKS